MAKKKSKRSRVLPETPSPTQVAKTAVQTDQFLSSSIDQHQLRLQSSINTLEDNIVNMVKEFETSDGMLVGPRVNLKNAQKIHAKLASEFDKTYGKGVRTIVADYDESAKFINRRWKDMNIAAEFTNFDADMIDVLKNNTWRNFNQFGLQAQEQLVDAMYGSIAGHQTFAQLKNNISGILSGFQDAKGKSMARYSTLYANDGLMNFHNDVTMKKAEDAGLEHFLYYGNLMNTSRGFCRTRAGNVYSAEEIRSWDGKLWSGKSGPALTSRGGYNCRHSWVPVRQDQVEDCGSKCKLTKGVQEGIDKELDEQTKQLKKIGAPLESEPEVLEKYEDAVRLRKKQVDGLKQYNIKLFKQGKKMYPRDEILEKLTTPELQKRFRLFEKYEKQRMKLETQLKAIRKAKKAKAIAAGKKPIPAPKPPKVSPKPKKVKITVNTPTEVVKKTSSQLKKHFEDLEEQQQYLIDRFEAITGREFDWDLKKYETLQFAELTDTDPNTLASLIKKLRKSGTEVLNARLEWQETWDKVEKVVDFKTYQAEIKDEWDLGVAKFRDQIQNKRTAGKDFFIPKKYTQNQLEQIGEALEEVAPKNVKETVKSYTQGSGKFNHGMRAGNVSEEVLKRTARLDEAIEHLPRVDGVTWRGMTLDTQTAEYKRFMNNLKPGNVFTDRGFTSTTLDSDYVREFVTGEGDNFYFKIHGKRGRYIPNEFTAFANEEEVLFRPGTKFKIKSVKWTKSPSVFDPNEIQQWAGQDVKDWTVVLEEII